MKRIIQFHIFKGERQYVAEGVDLPVVTQGTTLDELAANIQEAIDRGTLKAIYRQAMWYIPQDQLRPYFYLD